jgi:uncharacterized protein (DUF302 family)
MKTSEIEGLATVPSNFGPDETMARLEREIAANGMSVFSRINHAALASEMGMTLRPTEVILFGNPRGGTPLMQASQTIGNDLPLKVLLWQDVSGKTWLSYNKPAWLIKRHDLKEADRMAVQMESALASIALKATHNQT